MSLFKKIFGNTNSLSENELMEAGVCPNCWGQQEYDGKFVEFVNDQTKSNINHDKTHKKAFVQQFIETEVTGIRLKKEGDYLQCMKCELKHKYVSSKAT